MPLSLEIMQARSKKRQERKAKAIRKVVPPKMNSVERLEVDVMFNILRMDISPPKRRIRIPKVVPMPKEIDWIKVQAAARDI